MNEENVVAMYDSPAHADEAEQDLIAANVPRDAISRHPSTATTSGRMTGSGQGREPGFWGKMFGGQPEHENGFYDRSVESGSSVVAVRVPEEHVASVTGILERHNPIDMDERARAYGATANTRTSGEDAGVSPAGLSRDTAGRGTDEEVIPLSEEQISVGKRLVNRGTTRVRRYTVETPVEENVSLHSERVSIERRPATSSSLAGDTAFKDRSIEVTESDEEAVVGKTTRVREEVVIHKEVADRVETVRDTVRREDVEVVKEGGQGLDAAPDAAPAGRPKI